MKKKFTDSKISHFVVFSSFGLCFTMKGRPVYSSRRWGGGGGAG